MVSRGIQAKYKLLQIEDNIAYYAYGGANFNYPYDQDIYQECDGRIKLPLLVLTDHQDIGKAIEDKRIEVVKPCFYVEENVFGYDIFALRTITKIVSIYKKEHILPEHGMWIC